mgnify:FL=1
MARPQKSGVAYFSHDVGAHSKRTLSALRRRFGNDGYAFWFILLELLGEQEGLFLDCSDELNWVYLCTETAVDENTAAEILALLARVDAIDNNLWTQRKIIWCQSFAERLEFVYKKRRTLVPQKPTLEYKKTVSVTETVESDVVSVTKTPVSVTEMRQSKVKKRKVKDMMGTRAHAREQTQTSNKVNQTETLDHHAGRVNECVVNQSACYPFDCEGVETLGHHAGRTEECAALTESACCTSDCKTEVFDHHADRVNEYVDYYQSVIHPFGNQTEADAVLQLAKEYPLEEFKAACDTARNNCVKHSSAWKYIDKVLHNRSVRASSKRVYSKNKANDVAATTAEAIRILESGELDDVLG